MVACKDEIWPNSMQLSAIRKLKHIWTMIKKRENKWVRAE